MGPFIHTLMGDWEILVFVLKTFLTPLNIPQTFVTPLIPTYPKPFFDPPALKLFRLMLSRKKPKNHIITVI